MAPPGRCQPTIGEKLGILPAVVFGNTIGVPWRVLRWTGQWARRDPAEPHWHLGPVAVDPDLQGQGIGAPC
ncbi:MAG TPA: GNAT family N-acetyltransferase [Myxococcota bacterium]|nr:GNAT family N-acetyltransferase [Myxococcota bacterium]